MAVDYSDLPVEETVRILDAFRDQPAPVIQSAGADPVDQSVAGIRRYIEIVDGNLDGVVLTYRESRTLTVEGRSRIKELEIATAAPLRAVIEAGVARGVFREAGVDLTVCDIMLLAHGWALKRWHFGPSHTVDEYIALQTRHVLNSLVAEDRRAEYAHLLGGSS